MNKFAPQTMTVHTLENHWHGKFDPQTAKRMEMCEKEIERQRKCEKTDSNANIIINGIAWNDRVGDEDEVEVKDT